MMGGGGGGWSVQGEEFRVWSVMGGRCGVCRVRRFEGVKCDGWGK